MADVFPFEFVVKGLPISHQSGNKAKLSQWRQQVRQAAEAAWPPGEAPTTDEVELTVVCYFEKSAPDVDNFHKPIQDELQDLVYKNDKQVVRARPCKEDINGRFLVRYIRPVLARAFEDGDEFVHVMVDLATDDGVLIQLPVKT